MKGDECEMKQALVVECEGYMAGFTAAEGFFR